MGAGQTKEKQLDRFGQLLSAQEKLAVSSSFQAIAGTNEVNFFIESQLQAYLGDKELSLPNELISALFSVLHGTNSQFNQVSFPDYILHSSQLLQGTTAKRVWLLWKLFTHGEDPGKTTNFELSRFRSTLETFLKVIITSPLALSVLPRNSFSYYPEGYDRLLDFMVALLSSQKSSASSESSASESGQASAEDLEQLLEKSPFVKRIFELGFTFCFYREALKDPSPDASSSIRYQLGVASDSTSTDGEEGEGERVVYDKLLLPIFTPNPLIRESFGSMLLDQCGLILLNSYFPPDVRGQMFPLFSSHYQGESFSTFCKQLLSFRGPTVIVLKDKGGHIFGGFASEGWTCNPQFTGNSNCFLFTLHPQMGVYTPSGHNDHYMYLQQHAHTMSNGLGMGGQVDFFGLWLSSDFGHGHSKAKPKCSTYLSPMLSSSEEFVLELIEVWGVGSPAPPKGDEDEEANVSILDRDKTASALLEMAGRKLHSKELRQAPKEMD